MTVDNITKLKQEGRALAEKLGSRFNLQEVNPKKGTITIFEYIPFINLPFYRSSTSYCEGFKSYTFTLDDINSGSYLFMIAEGYTR